MIEDEELTLKELVEESGVSERTVRYYMANGIIPPAPRSGPGVRYPRGHLTRLRLVRRWQEENLPLEQIRKLLADLTDVEVERLYQKEVRTPEPEPEARGSAADYVKKALARSATRPRMPTQLPLDEPTEAPVARSTWERYVVDDDVEIHVRRPLSTPQNRRVDALLKEARRIMKEKPT